MVELQRPISPSATRGSILDEIVAYNRRRLPAAQRREPLAVLQRRIQQLPQPVDFVSTLRDAGVQLIAEVKKASPSAGLLRRYLRPVALARTYAAGGAAAISVLTEKRHFQGSLHHLSAIRQALDTQVLLAPAVVRNRPPLLRKDFLFDAYQVYQARAYGADALLLIVAVLNDTMLKTLLHLTNRLSMEALVEVHDEAETERALDCGARVIGINNRDLRTFRVDTGTTRRLRRLIPPSCVVVSESGIKTRDDIEQLRDWGADAVLIGEALITAPSVEAKLREFLP